MLPQAAEGSTNTSAPSTGCDSVTVNVRSSNSTSSVSGSSGDAVSITVASSPSIILPQPQPHGESSRASELIVPPVRASA